MSATTAQLSNHNKNNLDLSTNGMIYTLIINIVMFTFLLCFFEANRFYRQIFLKRFQKRFIDIGRVPPIPPRHMFGWLVAIFRVAELEVLHMVGLDGYMLLRYHTVCLKFTLFATVIGELSRPHVSMILLPVMRSHEVIITLRLPKSAQNSRRAVRWARGKLQFKRLALCFALI
jgi:hypothetical protein